MAPLFMIGDIQRYLATPDHIAPAPPKPAPRKPAQNADSSQVGAGTKKTATSTDKPASSRAGDVGTSGAERSGAGRGLSRYTFMAPSKADGAAPAAFTEALSRDKDMGPNLTGREIFAEAMHLAAAFGNFDRKAAESLAEDAAAELAKEAKKDVKEDRLGPAYAGLDPKARTRRAWRTFLEQTRPATRMEIAEHKGFDESKIDEKYGDANNYYNKNFGKYKRYTAGENLNIIKNAAEDLPKDDPLRNALLFPESKEAKRTAFEIQYIYASDGRNPKGGMLGILLKDNTNKDRQWAVTLDGEITTLSYEDVQENATEALGWPMVFCKKIGDAAPGDGTMIRGDAVGTQLRKLYKEGIESRRDRYKELTSAEIDNENKSVIKTLARKAVARMVPFYGTWRARQRGAEYDERMSKATEDLGRLKGGVNGAVAGASVGSVAGVPGAIVGGVVGALAGHVGVNATAAVSAAAKAVEEGSESAGELSDKE